MAKGGLRLVARVEGVARAVELEPMADGRWRVTIDGLSRLIDARPLPGGGWSLMSEGRAFRAEVASADGGETFSVALEGASPGPTSVTVSLLDPRREALGQVVGRGHGVGGPEVVRAPIPGKVVKLLVRAGEQVVPGQGLVVVEAMKMENELRAARPAGVTAVHVAEGQAVDAQEPLLTLA